MEYSREEFQRRLHALVVEWNDCSFDSQVFALYIPSEIAWQHGNTLTVEYENVLQVVVRLGGDHIHLVMDSEYIRALESKEEYEKYFMLALFHLELRAFFNDNTFPIS